MERLIEKVAVKVNSLSTTSKARVTCANCGKSNHSEDNCFKFDCTTSQTLKKINFESKYFGERINIFARHWASIFDYDYDRLPTKRALQQVEQSGVGIDGSKFAFDGIVYLNLVLSNEEGETFELSYEPVLFPSQVSSNTFGFNSEEKFTSCCRNSENNIITFTTRSRKSLKVKCYRENIEATTAYIRITKSAVVGTNTQTLVTHFDILIP